jgi:hypothetical protein
MPKRRFPPPWSVEEGETYFVVKDNDGQQLSYVHFDDLDQQPSRSPATKHGGSRQISRNYRSCSARLERATFGGSHVAAEDCGRYCCCGVRS